MAGERDRKLEILNGLAGNYAASLAPETAKMWLFLLREYSVAQVQEAALMVIRRHGSETVPYRTMPPFALMQKELDALTGTVRGAENVRLAARAEWGRLLELVRQYGSWREPEMNKTTAYCVRSMGGWEQVCRWKMDELTWRERDFVQLWEQSHDREEFLTLGCEAVKSLESPAGADMKRLESLRPLRALPEEREPVRRAVPMAAAQKPFDPSALSPELREAREALIAARAERMALHAG